MDRRKHGMPNHASRIQSILMVPETNPLISTGSSDAPIRPWRRGNNRSVKRLPDFRDEAEPASSRVRDALKSDSPSVANRSLGSGGDPPANSTGSLSCDADQKQRVVARSRDVVDRAGKLRIALRVQRHASGVRD